MLCPLVRQQTSHTHNCAFRSGVRRYADTTLVREHRSDVNDFAAFALSNELASHSLRHEEYALDVQVHYVVPVFFAEVDGIFTTNQTCVVNQNVDLAELSNRTLQQRWNTINLAQVSGQAQEAATQSIYTLDGFSRFNDVDTNDVTTSFCKTDSHTLAQTCITTSNNSNFTFQGE